MRARNDQPECDICSQCGEHAEYIDGLSNCCGARPYNVDIELEDRHRLMSLSRAAVMIFAAVVSVGCASAPRAETSSPIEDRRESIVHEANEFRAMGIYCVIKNRGLQDDPKYSMFYNVVKDEFARVNCGNFGTVQGD